MAVLLLPLLMAVAWADKLPVGSENGTTIDVMDKARSGCEYPFEPVGNGCYFYSEEIRNFAGAQKACESLGHGYDVTLATFDLDENEDEAILTKATSKDKTFWVGASTEDGENWQWADERPMYIKAPILYYQEPNESQNKCMVAQVTVSGNLKRSYLYDYGCEESMNFICHIGCPFEFHRIGQFCYFFSEEEGLSHETWQNSRDYCVSLSVPVGYHADLAVLGLDNQDTYRLMNIFADYSSYIYAWIGGFRENDYDYNWIDGRSLPTSSHYWSYSKPNYGSYDRVFIEFDTSYNSTYLRDNPDSSSFAFICQMFRD